ncbi:CpaE family protein [Vibrio amylolyticus]|uniref:AAA family ATPase n=1 Tax=Vibrio amylolyticus TaxID=2847292 RepID=UPI00354F0923
MSSHNLNNAPTIAAYFIREHDCTAFDQRYQDTALKAYSYCGSLDKALDKCIQLTELDVLIVQLPIDQQATALIKQITARLQPMTKLVLIGEEIDVPTYRQFISLGCSDYLPGIVDHDQLYQLTAKLTRYGLEQVNNARGVLVWGVKGGVGTTTISASLARLFATRHHRYTLAIDADMYSGDLGLALNEENSGQLSSLLTYSNELDSLLVRRSLVEVSENLSLLNDSLELNQSISIEASQLGALAEYANAHYAIHLWDKSPLLSENLSTLLTNIKLCVLVCDLSMSSALSLAKALNYLERFPHVRPVVVVNETRKKTHQWFTVQELEQSLDITVNYQLPFAGSLLIKSQEQGTSPDSGQSAWAKEMRNIASDCLGLATPKHRTFSPFAWFGGKR